MKERKPIFYDAEKVRWRRTRRILESSGVLLTLLLVYFFVTVAGSVELPSSLIPDTRPVYHSVKKKNTKVASSRQRHLRVARIGQIPEGYDPLRAAFFVSWDANSLATLKKHYKDLDLLMPEQLHAVTPDGAISVVDYERGSERVKTTPAEAIRDLESGQAAPVDALAESACRTADDGFAEQLRWHGVAHKRDGRVAGEFSIAPAPGQAMSWNMR